MEALPEVFLTDEAKGHMRSPPSDSRSKHGKHSSASSVANNGGSSSKLQDRGPHHVGKLGLPKKGEVEITRGFISVILVRI
jgi:hypothetical protein